MSKAKIARLSAFAHRNAAKVSVAVLTVAGATQSAFAVDPTSAQEALTTLSAGNTGYGPVMWGLALAAVGVLIGVKWIKRGRGAA